MAIDETFVLELALVESLTDGAGAERLCQEVLAQLPSDTRKVRVDEVRAAIDQISNWHLDRLCSRSAQGKVDAVLEVLCGMERGADVSHASFQECPFLRAVLARLPWFSPTRRRPCPARQRAGSRSKGTRAC